MCRQLFLYNRNSQISVRLKNHLLIDSSIVRFQTFSGNLPIQVATAVRTTISASCSSKHNSSKQLNENLKISQTFIWRISFDVICFYQKMPAKLHFQITLCIEIFIRNEFHRVRFNNLTIMKKVLFSLEIRKKIIHDDDWILR